jgi:D-methionine transport system permease protein
MLPILISALRETLFMVLAASLLTIFIGIPLGCLLANIATIDSKPIKGLYYAFYSLTELAKSVPYLLLMLLFLPVINWLIAHKISYHIATIAPLATAGSLVLASRVYTIVAEKAQSWSATSKALGATKNQTFWLILLPETLTPIILASSSTCSLLVGFSTVAGALGAGGLGQLAIEKSIHDSNLSFVLLCIGILVVIQQLIAYTGSLVVRQTQPR